MRATGVDLLGCWYRGRVMSPTCAEEKRLHALSQQSVDSQTTRYPVTATTATLPSPSTPRLLHSFLLSIPPTYSPPLLYSTSSIPPAILTPLRSAPLPIPPPVAHEPLWYDVTSHLKPPANLPFHHAEPYHHHSHPPAVALLRRPSARNYRCKQEISLASPSNTT